jgi:glucoamylase
MGKILKIQADAGTTRDTPAAQTDLVAVMPERPAPGGPGLAPRWTSSAKTGVGTALGTDSRVWFTLSHGIFDEVYYPRIDQACIRDMGLIVTDGAKFFSEEKRDARHAVEWMADGVPAFRLFNTCRDGRYAIEKEIVTDPHRDTVLQDTRFIPKKGPLSGYRLYVLLAPHLENHGEGNTAWLGEYEGVPLLFAQRNGCALALACSSPWLKRSVGYVGSSDGWQDLKAHGQITEEYTRAENGNVAEIAEIDLAHAQGHFTLALGLGPTPDEAARNAVASLRDGFKKARTDYIAGWKTWQKTHASLHDGEPRPGDLAKKSLAVLRTHEAKLTPGAFIASLAIPWGFNKGDEDQGGYHLVWPRDMVETAGGLLAAGVHDDACRILAFFESTQLADGHWPQNMWLDGSPYWNGIQMDETALPILLMDLAYREKALTEGDLVTYWPMVRKAAAYLVCNGPISMQDRWEEDPGYTPFTVAAEIAALLAAADIADLNHEKADAAYFRETADIWNDCIDHWMYKSDRDWRDRFGVNGYYIRIATQEEDLDSAGVRETVRIKNVTADLETIEADHLISPDALALVRFGLRAADDPRMVDTVKVIDALLRVETPGGSTWHRYNGDGYGEHADGAPFDGTGIGRGWPLLTGERAHYELAAGRKDVAQQMLTAMEFFANESGLLPEQVWDSPSLPARELRFGQASGSAMPLVWAHAEYLKLQRSLRDGTIFDCPPQTVQRYLVDKTVSPRMSWRYNHKIQSIPSGKILRIELAARASIHWSDDDWKTIQDTVTTDTGLGIHWVDLPVMAVGEGGQIKFTFHWMDADHWEGQDFVVSINN